MIMLKKAELMFFHTTQKKNIARMRCVFACVFMCGYVWLCVVMGVGVCVCVCVTYHFV